MFVLSNCLYSSSEHLMLLFCRQNFANMSSLFSLFSALVPRPKSRNSIGALLPFQLTLSTKHSPYISCATPCALFRWKHAHVMTHYKLFLSLCPFLKKTDWTKQLVIYLPLSLPPPIPILFFPSSSSFLSFFYLLPSLLSFLFLPSISSLFSSSSPFFFSSSYSLPILQIKPPYFSLQKSELMTVQTVSFCGFFCCLSFCFCVSSLSAGSGNFSSDFYANCYFRSQDRSCSLVAFFCRIFRFHLPCMSQRCHIRLLTPRWLNANSCWLLLFLCLLDSRFVFRKSTINK